MGNCIVSYQQPAQDAQDCLLSFASVWVPPRTGWQQRLVIMGTEALLFFKTQQEEFKRQEALLRYPGIICVLPLKAKFVIKAGICEQPASAGHPANRQRGHALWHCTPSVGTARLLCREHTQGCVHLRGPGGNPAERCLGNNMQRNRRWSKGFKITALLFHKLFLSICLPSISFYIMQRSQNFFF